MPINLLLKCYDVEQTKSFYDELLGFSVRDSANGTCTVQKDDCTLIFTSADNVGGAPNFSGTIYCFINDVDGYYEQIKDIAIIRWPLEDMEYGTREFAIKDNNDYTLAFAQDNTASS